MTPQLDRLRPALPFVVAGVILIAGFMLLVRPALTRATTLSAQIEGLERRLAAVQASVSAPAPPPVTDKPADVFTARVSAGDGTPRLIEQLARLAAAVGATNLSIEAGEPVTVVEQPPDAPRAAERVEVDPRLALFEVPVDHSPVTMVFDVPYAGLGEMLWQLRDLPTLTDIRDMTLSQRSPASTAARDGRINARITMFAHVRRQPAPATRRAAGAMP